MQLKINNLKFLNRMKYIVICVSMLLSYTTITAQEIIEEEVKKEEKKVETRSDGRIKIDGVAAVVGEFVVLDSDIDEQFKQLKAGGVSIENITRCQMVGQLLESKLYIHQAIQDSIVINDAEIRSYTDQQLNAFLRQANGSMPRLLKIFSKKSEQELRADIYEINKNNSLAQKMQEKVIAEIEVTPEEVREYYNDIPKSERPIIGTELKIAQIIVIPKITQEEKQKVIDRLNEFRTDILENGASFNTKAVLYSQDTGSKARGGKLDPMIRSRPRNIKEFRDVAFSLQEGEISEPFETIYGFHIIYLEKIRGQEYDVRHILLRPEIPQIAIDEAKQKLKDVRKKIIAGEISFADAAREVSEQKETKFEGGLLLNSQTGDYSFDLTNMEPSLYAQIEGLKDGEISEVLNDADRVNEMRFKLLTVSDRVDEHEAEFARDYVKVREFALNDKKLKAIEKWQKEKIIETYVKLNGEHRKCEFNSNWLKKEK
ncbi:peptidylprolyl isomerase [Flavobacteriaceae bacterium AU392]|nr:peptidylprolyl isomerase [Flavobacteriaceae bacterium]RKM86820.1 peptidylprolyl isomerase [Flavobacteriaceae bacterium AU392]